MHEAFSLNLASLQSQRPLKNVNWSSKVRPRGVARRFAPFVPQLHFGTHLSLRLHRPGRAQWSCARTPVPKWSFGTRTMKIRTDPTMYMPFLLQAITDKSSETRFGATAIIATLGTDAEALDGKDDSIRIVAAVIALIGPDAKAAVPSLTKLLKHQDRAVRIAAAVAGRDWLQLQPGGNFAY
jgi:hypothetical protein